MSNRPRIIRNRIRCKKCDTVLESRFTHDFQQCKCGIFVDGGGSYVRIGGWKNGKTMEDCIEVLTEYEKD